MHIGSKFPERDGGGIVVESKNSAYVFYTPGGKPGEMLDVYGIEIGKGTGYTDFARAVGYLFGIDASPKQIMDDLSDEIALRDEDDTRRLARSLKGRVQLVEDMISRDIFEDYEENVSQVPYAHIERVWAAQSPRQRSLGPEFRGLRGLVR
jgi:hypothetical protein